MPGRVDSVRSARASLLERAARAALGWGVAAVGLTAVVASGCASERAAPHPDLTPVWRDFLALPAERALAIAGDLRRDRWVAGISGGCTTREEAEAEALLQCRKQRGLRRMRAACALYAVGDEIVWRGP